MLSARMARGIRASVLAFVALTHIAVADDVPPGLEAQMPENPSGRLDHILKRGTLIVGVKGDYPPWGMVGPDGTPVGLEPDLARDLARRMGVGLELRPVTASNRIARVNQGIVDVVIATTGDTAARRNRADLLEPGYYSSGVVVYGRADLDLRTWEELKGQPVCLNQGAYYNRTLEETYGVDGRYFASNRESQLAVLHGRCIGWAFDDTALAQLIRTAPDDDFAVMEETIEVTPWAIIVARGEGQADLGRFVSDMIAEWHAGGRILELQDKWGLPRTAYLRDKHATWSAVEDGRAVCARDRSGAFPATCLDPAPYASAPLPDPPGWMTALHDRTGIDLRAFTSPYIRARLLRGLGLTLALSVCAILGALIVGVGLGLIHASLEARGWIGRLLLVPQRVLISVARMTPPILQLYILFFGIGATTATGAAFTPGGFVIAIVVFSLYAGSTNAVILSHAFDQERELNPEASALARLPKAFERGFDGLVATCVNIVKAAGMASAIAVGEVISSVNLTVSEGADTTTLMNGLLVFYFLLVLGIIWLFKRLKSWMLAR
ncbi:transporter substrate-binding domain-containing protein [Sulfitobacter sp. D35]|uniref:transporter substrate-binding domain-containing protein n=1 Tax=Sulfitobacter sp. D35 TaxID=3083252 RepID=UPI00296F707D|nr:transporter substrate-binding domain-containing protein [Sulfitobacter sp. D35]MDW4497081.1 transporter substrate-binding domain-containing protein [Sulfitobacter sp. D35]